MSTRWIVDFEAIDPQNPNERRWKTGIRPAHFRMLQQHSHEKSMARLVLIQKVLQGGTTHLYEGWNRPDRESCYVYIGKPNRDYVSLTIDVPAPPRMVFAVFVLPDGTIDEWNWRNEEENGSPKGITGRLLWSLNPNSESS